MQRDLNPDRLDDGARAEAEMKEREAATHRHKKRGSEYVLLGFGKMQAEKWYRRHGVENAVDVDMAEVAIYRSISDGSLWARPREEFEDGRFEALPAALPAPQGDDGLVARLEHLVSLNEPAKGGPYQGFAAAQCIEAMQEAASALHSQAAEIAGLKAERDDAVNDAYRSGRKYGEASEKRLGLILDAANARAEAAEAKLASAMEALTEMVERERRRYDNTPEAQAHFERNNAAALAALASPAPGRSVEGWQTNMPNIGPRPHYCKPREFLLIASYCGDDTPGCTDARPCVDCLAMCNVFGEDGTYLRQLGTPAAPTEGK